MNQRDFEWTRDFWQGWRESNNLYRRYKSQRDRELLLKVLDVHDGDRVLEVGCGYGWISRALWDAAQIDWFGVDSSPDMIVYLRDSQSARGVHASVADACQLSFKNEEFDKVICTGVLMHIRQDLTALRELVRVLRPGGQLVCSINNALSLYSLPVQLWNARKPGFVQKFRIPTRFQSTLRELGVQPTGIAGDGIVATVPITVGGLSFPPQRSFSALSRLDKCLTDWFPWLAYEVWFSAVKVDPPCVS